MAVSLQWLATFSAAVFAGGALYISIVEHPARMKAGVAVAVAEFRQMYRRAAPWQASAAAISLVAGLLSAVLTADYAWALGGLAVGAVIPFTLIAMLGITRRLLDTHPPRDDDAALLARWGRLHLVRSVLGTLGFIVLLSKAVLK